MKRFKAGELLSGLQLKETAGDTGVTVEDIVYDSRRARPETVFVAIRGNLADGHNYAREAYKKGCRAFVVEKPVDVADAAQFIVEDTRLALAAMSVRFFADPSSGLSLTGVTGTNGKTTTAYMLDSIYRAAGSKSGIIGTVEYRVAGSKRPVSRTTPESYDLQALLREMVDAGVGRAVLEVSSHAITQKRVQGTTFAAKIFTNISRDHLDYHKDMEEYYEAKKHFMLDGNVPAIVNIDDVKGRELAAEAQKTITFSLENKADYSAADIRSDINGTTFSIRTLEGEFPVKLGMPGDFNVMNALAAAAAARVQDVGWAAISSGLKGLTAVPGRFERLRSERGFSVIVDYAHTPDSLEKTILAARMLTADRVITVFGCGGDRDRGKRSEMGKIATELSDKVIITSDNPRSEDPEDIISDIAEGAGGEYIMEPDRRLAIRKAIASAQPGDIILIAGKGHEKTQEFKDRIDEFDDTAVAGEEMARTGVKQ